MEYEITKNPVGIIEFTLQKGEMVTAEAAAMVFIIRDIETKTGIRKSSFLKSLKAAALGGESFFVNNFITRENNCILGITGNMIGDIEVIHVDEEFIVQSGSYVGSTGSLTLDTKWQGSTNGIFGSDLFMLKTIGIGDLFVNGWAVLFQKK